MDVELKEFCEAMKRVHGYTPDVHGGSLVNGRDLDRYEGWRLARHGAGDAEDAPAIEPCVGAEKAESLCVHCFSSPHMWGMICCKGYWNDPRTEMLTETQARAKRAARAGERGVS